MNRSTRLFTPGPLNTSDTVREKMNADLGSRTKECQDLTKNICNLLKDIAGHGDEIVPVLLQGSGTFAVEAMITSLIPSQGCVLVVANGEYGRRMATICEVYGINHHVAELDEYKAVSGKEITPYLEAHPEISHIAMVHFETALGVVNDVYGIQKLCELRKVALLIDAMSSFGALSLPFNSTYLEGVAASSNKCLHGVPGLSFVFCRVSTLEAANTPRSLSLDLKKQHLSFKNKGQWRFTPPIQVMLAFEQALQEYNEQGGDVGRLAKYQKLNQKLSSRLAELGMTTVIDESLRAPMITTYTLPETLSFEDLYYSLHAKGLVIYPSKINDCFRLGCIGELEEHDIERLTDAIAEIV